MHNVNSILANIHDVKPIAAQEFGLYKILRKDRVPPAFIGALLSTLSHIWIHFTH